MNSTKAQELLMAAANGDVSEICALIKEGVDPNSVHPEVGNSALYNAIFCDQLPAIRALLQNGADPNFRLNYRSPIDGRQERGVVALMYARSGEVASMLLDAGADPNAADELGNTPLVRATVRGKEDVVRILLDAGADRHVKTNNGKSLVDVAHAAIAEYESWAVDANRNLIAQRVAKYGRICEMLTAVR